MNLYKFPFRLFEALCSKLVDAAIKQDIKADRSARFYFGAVVENMRRQREAVTVGAQCAIRGRLVTFPHGGEIRIGANSFVGQNSNIWSAASITIGERVMISHSVEIHDTNSHSLDAQLRHQHFLKIVSTGHPEDLPDVPAKPIVIEDDAWIGFRSIILKGVTIGRGAVVAAGATVTQDVEPWTVVAGSPAVVVKKLPAREDVR